MASALADSPTRANTSAAKIVTFPPEASANVDVNGEVHGFLRSRGGDFTAFDVPGESNAPGEGVAPFSINLFGTATGEYFDSNSVMHGFSRTAAGRYAKFDAPGAGTGAGQGTRASTNNAEGSVTGWVADADNLNHGFLWEP
jgi:hypothetical protein